MARPEDVVAWLGAVQAQEYHLAKWGLALRTRRASDASVERAFAAGRILRTHVMRATWHFVTPADIRWLLALTAPRVRAAVAFYDRQLGITPAVITRANRAIARALAGGAELTRGELKAVLAGAKVSVEATQRLAHVVMHAELDAVICSGARRDKQFTYALLDDRAPAGPLPSREEALAELVRRYFTSHGPAQLKDFAWWSGLTSADARMGLETSRRHLAEEEIGGKRYWLAASGLLPGQPLRAAYLLQPYDEFLIAFKDRSASLDGMLGKSGAGRGPYAAPIVLDGRVVGGWRRSAAGGRVTITVDIPERLAAADARLVREAVQRYGDFLGQSVITVTV